MSTCVKCGGHLFKIKEQSPSGSNFKVFFIQCSSCGVPVGTMDYYHTASLLENLEKKVNRLIGEIDQIKHSLGVINHNIGLIAKR